MDKKIVAFLCNWCSYAGADLAGVSRFQYPPSLRIIRIPCSGRVDPLFLFKALKHADGILVAGCHPGDCHYTSGNLVARRKFALVKSLLDFVGVEDGVVQFDWISAAEGNKFAETATKVCDEIQELPQWDKWGERK